MGVGYLVMRSAFFLSSQTGYVIDMLWVGVVSATTPTSEELYQVCSFSVLVICESHGVFVGYGSGFEEESGRAAGTEIGSRGVDEEPERGCGTSQLLFSSCAFRTVGILIWSPRKSCITVAYRMSKWLTISLLMCNSS